LFIALSFLLDGIAADLEFMNKIYKLNARLQVSAASARFIFHSIVNEARRPIYGDDTLALLGAGMACS
jgi:hypothetical protein